MSYKEIELPKELRKSFQEICEVSGSGPRTLGDFARNYPRVVGVPEPEAFLSREPTPHEVRVKGRTLYTHCFIDALMLPFMLRAEPVEIRSESPLSGETIMALATRQTVESSPQSAVMSFGAVRVVRDAIQGAVCPYINAFISQAEYGRWEAQTPQAVTVALPLPEAFAFARDMIGELTVPEGWGAAL